MSLILTQLQIIHNINKVEKLWTSNKVLVISDENLLKILNELGTLNPIIFSKLSELTKTPPNFESKIVILKHHYNLNNKIKFEKIHNNYEKIHKLNVEIMNTEKI